MAASRSRSLTQPLPATGLADAELHYQAQFLSAVEADHYLAQLQQQLDWRQDRIRLFGRETPIPRLQAWYGDPGLHYRYSGLSLYAQGWPDPLLALKQQLEQQTGQRFNAVLANLYRNGVDSMGWHADDEPELGPNPVIASLSLGQPRPFQLRRRDDPIQRYELLLEHGSLLLMAGSTQHHWQHALPKRTRLTQPRINLTFRRIIQS
ncbi:alpha-ketoglutarate-dependent dioxygenase AlkB family protein [Motiliproteus sp.]|uniref:alpha-ketoglutarate-dependent dioxygenase AlkB family protein n=1 Tax=Motiliproteus sp. TaxID=1898955 RepID=UPI003BABAB32